MVPATPVMSSLQASKQVTCDRRRSDKMDSLQNFLVLQNAFIWMILSAVLRTKTFISIYML